MIILTDTATYLTDLGVKPSITGFAPRPLHELALVDDDQFAAYEAARDAEIKARLAAYHTGEINVPAKQC